MTTREFDPAALLDGNIDGVTARFADHDDAQLGTLLEAEKAGKNRAGLIEAIGREQATRQSDAEAKAEDSASAKAPSPPAAGAAPPSPPEGGEGEKTYSQAEVDAIHAEHVSAMANAEQANRDAIANLTAELGEARKALSDAAKRGAARPPKAVKANAPRKLAVLGKASGDGLRVAFGDEHDMSIPELAELEFGAGDFEKVPGSDAVTLNRALDFDESTPTARISAVWLVDGRGEAHAVCRLMQPFAIGGGSVGQIPAKFLSFTGGKVPAAA